MTHQPPRVDVQTARRELGSGQSLLVCAYDDDDKCRSMLIEGALTWNQIGAHLGDLDTEQPIILYCA